MKKADKYAKALINGAGLTVENTPEQENRNHKEKNISDFERVERFISDRYDLRYNIVSNLVEFKEKDSNNNFVALRENNLYRELQKNFINFSKDKLKALLGSDFVPEYDPFFYYFENLPEWKETDPDYIEILCKYIPAKDQKRFNKHLKKMLVRCIACSFTVAFNKQAFILVHDVQNSGKSTFCRWLCPPALSAYITEDIELNSKDGKIALCENFIINLDELSAVSKQDINKIKAFISTLLVKVRPPYGDKAVPMKRRASFFGNTNKEEFLNDETGSVRWLCFELSDKINFNYSKDIDINKIWSQAYYLYKTGFKYELTPEEVAENEAANNHFRITTTEQELIQTKFKPSEKGKAGAIYLSATDVLNELVKENTGFRSNRERIGKALKSLGFIQQGQTIDGRTIKVYFVERI
jgi:predicted P-loop ATPase